MPRRGVYSRMVAMLCAFLILAAHPPDTPAGRTLAAWLEGFNSADRAKIAAFLRVHAPKRQVEDALQFREETGGFELIRILKSEPTALTALVRVREATRVQAPGTTYGYGFGVSTEAGMAMFGHSGGAPGMNGALRIYPERGYVMAVLSNLDPPAANRVADWLEQRLPAR